MNSDHNRSQPEAGDVPVCSGEETALFATEPSKAVPAGDPYATKSSLISQVVPPESKPDSSSDDKLHVGRDFGRYRILARLGRGGMGAVYLAEDTQLDRRVALKVPSLAGDDGEVSHGLIQRFQREARSAATVAHPNICPIYDVGQFNGVHYLTMAYVEGQTLAEVLKAGGPFAPDEAVGLLQKVALAVDEAHRHGIIHRDLKPANIMLDRRGEPIVMDFGLARRLSADDAPLTEIGAIVGTPAYMAPEQLSGKHYEVSAASDIYSLGVILYELLTKCRPFTGEMLAMISSILTEQPRPPVEIRPDLDVRLSAICLKAMHKNPHERFQTAQELATALAGIGLPHAKLCDVKLGLVSVGDRPMGRDRDPNHGALATVLPQNTTVPIPGIRLELTTRRAGVVKLTIGIVFCGSLFVVWTLYSSNIGSNPEPSASIPNGTEFQPVVAATSNETAVPPSKSSAVPDKTAGGLPKLEMHVQPASFKSGYKVLSSADLPLRYNDKVQLHVTLDESAYVYVFWFDALGKGTLLWPKDLDDQHPVREIWDPAPAPEGETQEWYEIGADTGLELVLVAASQNRIQQDALTAFAKTRLAIARLDNAGRLTRVALVEGVDAAVAAGSSVLVLPQGAEKTLLDLQPERPSDEDEVRGVIGQVKSPKGPLPPAVDDFKHRVATLFGSYSGLVFAHE